ncbi:MAG TPA: hypothetical protein VHZ33_19715 [Trebonia sp.]|jgi:hypothetical protein|nr:hypothetical protein [Trebonia sp.]
MTAYELRRRLVNLARVFSGTATSLRRGRRIQSRAWTGPLSGEGANAASRSPAAHPSVRSYSNASAGAYASAPAFDANDAVTHAASLARIPVRVASGYDDPFYPGVQALARARPASAVVDFSKGCHTGPFFLEQEPPSLAFLARYLAH